MVVPGDVHSTQEGPRGEGNQHVNDANMLCRDTWPGGQMDELDGSRGVKGVQDRKCVVDHAGYNGNHCRNEENKCDSSTDT